MRKIKPILRKYFFLPLLPTVLISTPAYALVIYVLVNEMEGLLAYFSYAYSSYALIISITVLLRVKSYKELLHKKIYNTSLVKKIESVPIGKRFLGDVRFRTEISLYQGFFINLLYIIMKLSLGIYYHSMWFISIAVYYVLLAVMQFMLLRRGKKRTDRSPIEEELRRYRFCGAMLLMMNQALAGILIFIVHQNQGYEYPGLFIYVMALYSFYAIIIAVVNLAKFHKKGSPVLAAAKVVKVVAAMVSILALETAMTTRFGGEDVAFRQMATAATGGGVCTIVLGMAIYMIVKSNKDLKK